MDLMREAGKPLSTTDIVSESMRRKGLELDDVDRRAFQASLFTILKRFKKTDVVKQSGKDGVTAIWELL